MNDNDDSKISKSERRRRRKQAEAQSQGLADSNPDEVPISSEEVGPFSEISISDFPASDIPVSSSSEEVRSFSDPADQLTFEVQKLVAKSNEYDQNVRKYKSVVNTGYDKINKTIEQINQNIELFFQIIAQERENLIDLAKTKDSMIQSIDEGIRTGKLDPESSQVKKFVTEINNISQDETETQRKINNAIKLVKQVYSQINQNNEKIGIKDLENKLNGLNNKLASVLNQLNPEYSPEYPSQYGGKTRRTKKYSRKVKKSKKIRKSRKHKK
jgi:hypothetical protein